ncbi:MAG: TIGR03067 domain-containing protein [Gemmataceae bacterium]|nr:TIGR03067 domain-containing protein [Gemmataceae bacterium]MCS7270036.1 TIGR03067 domain-containing protein [Gemmataceae bacterium]MDW8242997.1 TIGR03067 domain-containing protein [Thermogemmata sp.]
MPARIGTTLLIYWLTAWGILAGGALPGRSQPPPSSDAEALLGIWEVVALEAGGRPESDKNYRWTTFVFTRDKLTLREGFNPPVEFAYTLDPTTLPKTIDLTVRGHTARGIYKLEGDELVLCISMGGPRPTAFTSRGRNDTEMFTLRRSSWERYTEPTLGFVVEAPGKWQRTTELLRLPSGPVTLHLYQAVAVKERLTFTVGVASLPGRPGSGKAIDALFDAVEKFLEKLGGEDLVAEENKIKAPGPWPARELTFRPLENTDKPLLRARLYLIGDRLFILAVSGPEEQVRIAAFRFWATFRPPPADVKKTEVKKDSSAKKP